MTSLPLLLAALCVLFALVVAEPSRYKITFKEAQGATPRYFNRFTVVRQKFSNSGDQKYDDCTLQTIEVPVGGAGNVLELDEIDREGEKLTQIMAFYSDYEFISVSRDELVGFVAPVEEIGLIDLAYDHSSARNEGSWILHRIVKP